MTYSPTGKLRLPGASSSLRARPTWGWVARRKNRSVMESIRRLAISRYRFPRRRKSRCCLDRLRLLALGDAPSARHRLLSGKTSLSAPFHFLSRLPHGLLRDDATFASRKRSFSFIKACKKFRALPFASFPQGESFLHCVLGVAKPARLDSLTNKRVLIGRQMYFHRLSLETGGHSVNFASSYGKNGREKLEGDVRGIRVSYFQALETRVFIQ